MSYLTKESVNTWLASTKYTVSGIEPELDASVVAAGFGILSVRYDTSVWVAADPNAVPDPIEATTPALVLVALSMIYAAWFLQRQISEDELLEQSYPIRLENRGWMLLKGILNDDIDLPGVDPDPELVDLKGPLFFPTDASTQLAKDDPCDPDGSPLAFTMGARY